MDANNTYLDEQLKLMDPLKKTFLVLHFEAISQYLQSRYSSDTVPKTLLEFHALRQKVK